MQVQSHGSHGKVLQAAPPARKLPLHLPSPGPITGVLRGEVGWGGVGGSPPQAQSAHLIVQAQEAQGIANTLHLVQDARAQHHGCEGDVDGAVAPRRDHLADKAASALHNRPPPQPCLGDAPRSSQPHPLTTCLGLMENRWSEGTPSCPRRMTEMIFWGAPALELPSAYGQGSH